LSRLSRPPQDSGRLYILSSYLRTPYSFFPPLPTYGLHAPTLLEPAWVTQLSFHLPPPRQEPLFDCYDIAELCIFRPFCGWSKVMAKTIFFLQSPPPGSLPLYPWKLGRTLIPSTLLVPSPQSLPSLRANGFFPVIAFSPTSCLAESSTELRSILSFSSFSVLFGPLFPRLFDSEATSPPRCPEAPQIFVKYVRFKLYAP